MCNAHQRCGSGAAGEQLLEYFFGDSKHLVNHASCSDVTRALSSTVRITPHSSRLAAEMRHPCSWMVPEAIAGPDRSLARLLRLVGTRRTQPSGPPEKGIVNRPADSRQQGRGHELARGGSVSHQDD